MFRKKKYCPEVWNQIHEISCWKHFIYLQDRDSDRCICFEGKVAYTTAQLQ